MRTKFEAAGGAVLDRTRLQGEVWAVLGHPLQSDMNRMPGDPVLVFLCHLEQPL
jgi:hypothetical protein